MLRDTANTHATSMYGAIWFSHLDDSSTNGMLYRDAVAKQCDYVDQFLYYSQGCDRFKGVGYTIQYNYTALHGALLFEKLANEALIRRGTSNFEISVETTIQPLPVTTVEKRIGAGTDAFLAWFLVSTFVHDIILNVPCTINGVSLLLCAGCR
jgi:hypothetical protein